MGIQISGQQIDLGSSLQTYVGQRIEETVDKYCNSSLNSSVAFKREGNGFSADILVHANARTMINSRAESDNIYRAFDDALARIAKRLRRHKRWLVEHRAEIAQEPNTMEARAPASVRHSLVQWDGQRNEEAPNEALVIAELDTPIQSMTVAHAVRLLDLGEELVFMFRNASTTAINVVYRRSDGNIGWIES